MKEIRKRGSLVNKTGVYIHQETFCAKRVLVAPKNKRKRFLELINATEIRML